MKSKRRRRIAARNVSLRVRRYTSNGNNGQRATVTITFRGLTGNLGVTRRWEAALYKGAIPGQETEGRFTPWKPLANGAVHFRLPADILEGETAPWGMTRNTYVRIRTTNGYPTFDFVSRPFTLREGAYGVLMFLGSVAGRIGQRKAEALRTARRIIREVRRALRNG